MRTVTTFSQLAAITAVCALGTAAPALATPASGVSVQTLTQFDVPGALMPTPPGHPPTTGTVEVAVRRLEIAPGGTTGWHSHAGHVNGMVVSGTLTRVMADCTRMTSPAGSTVAETPDADHVGLNTGTTPVVVMLVTMLPKGAPLLTDAPAHCP